MHINNCQYTIRVSRWTYLRTRSLHLCGVVEETRREDRFGQIDTYRELVKESLLANLVFCREPVRARVCLVISRV